MFPSMDSCSHSRLILIQKQQGRKLRCLHCNLTIDEAELGDGCCPECLEARGVRHDDFQEMLIRDDGEVEYRCEDCSALIRTGAQEEVD